MKWQKRPKESKFSMRAIGDRYLYSPNKISRLDLERYRSVGLSNTLYENFKNLIMHLCLISSIACALLFSGCSGTLPQCPIVLDSANAKNLLRLFPNNRDKSYSVILVCGAVQQTLVGKVNGCLSEPADSVLIQSFFALCDGGKVLTPTPTSDLAAWGGLGDVPLFTSTKTPVGFDPEVQTKGRLDEDEFITAGQATPDRESSLLHHSLITNSPLALNSASNPAPLTSSSSSATTTEGPASATRRIIITTTDSPLRASETSFLPTESSLPTVVPRRRNSL